MSHPAARQPTIIDVAERAGVSKSLVSLVMRGAGTVREEKRRRVLEAAEALGYRPNAVARSLVRRRTNLLGMLLPDLHNPFYAEVVGGVQAEARALGYRTVLCATDAVAPEEERALDTLLELRVDGLVLASPLHSLDTMLARVSRELPVIVVAGPSSVTHVDSVRSDDGEGAELAVQHLLELGHRRIAYLDDASGSGTPERRAGYERAMHAHGLGAHVRIATGSHGERGIAALLATGARPTAIFAANDVVAFGAIGELGEQGLRVPDDVSVVGYDNTLLSSMRNVALTTVDQPRAAMGRQAVTMLLERLSGERDIPRHVVTTPTLVIRATTAPPTRA